MAVAEARRLGPALPPPEIVLTLSREEARLVLAVIGGLSGTRFDVDPYTIYSPLINALVEIGESKEELWSLAV